MILQIGLLKLQTRDMAYEIAHTGDRAYEIAHTGDRAPVIDLIEDWSPKIADSLKLL
jgi:hypothetical protein